MHSLFVVVECVSDVDRQSLHSVGEVFEQFLIKDALDLRDDRVHIVVGVASKFVLVETDIRHLCQEPGSYLCADAEERAAVHGEI